MSWWVSGAGGFTSASTQPRGISTEGNERVGINTQRYTESEIARVALSALNAAAPTPQEVVALPAGAPWRLVGNVFSRGGGGGWGCFFPRMTSREMRVSEEWMMR